VPIREDTVELRQRAVIPVAQTVPLVPYDSFDDDREHVEDNEQYNWHFWDSALRKYENYKKKKYENTVKFRDIHQMVVWFLTITVR
jgi:hypothetical protein